MKHTIVLLLLTIIAQSASQNIRTLLLSKTEDVRYQCVDPGCSSPTTITVATLIACEIACLSNVNCRTATYDQSNSDCELFADIPSQYGNIVAQAGVVTLMAIDDRRLSAPMKTSTTMSSTTATSSSTNTPSAPSTPTPATPSPSTPTSTSTLTLSSTSSSSTTTTAAPCNTTYMAQTTYATGSSSSPRYVAGVDVNSDNKPDIIVANYGSNNVGVLLNTGNGTFTAQTTYSTGISSSPMGVAVVDVNSDNKPDIIVANSGSNNVGVLLNTGNGTFAAQTNYSTGSSSSPMGVAVVDVNSDSKPDIIVANYASNNVGVLLNTGNGTFTAQTTYSTGSSSNPRSVAVLDVNYDSKPDIIVINYASNNVGVLLNTGNGTFTAQTTYTTGSSPYCVAVVDVNSDNKPDIIVSNTVSSNVGVLLAYCN